MKTLKKKKIKNIDIVIDDKFGYNMQSLIKKLESLVIFNFSCF